MNIHSSIFYGIQIITDFTIMTVSRKYVWFTCDVV